VVDRPKITISYSVAEIRHLHSEIGDLPNSRLGPKLREFYRRLEALLNLYPTKKVKKHEHGSGHSKA